MKINRLQTLYFMFFLLAFSKSILAADFLSESGCKYLIENLVGDSYVAIGARVKIRKESSGEVTNAFFLGKRGNRLHYLTKEKSPKKFYIDLAPENNSIRFEEIVESIEQVESICSPLSALSCLRVLNQQNGLPTEIQKRLEIEPEKLLEEMIDEFGQETLQNRDKLGELEAGEHDGRRQQHDLIRGFLAKNGVRSESTMSYRKLIAHLKKKLPAIISVHVATKILFEPSLDDDWQEPVLIYDKRLSDGSFPVPKWAPANHGPHAVTGVGVIPANKLLAGRRLLVLDTANNAINVWPILPVRLARPRFILVFPSKNEAN